MIIIITAGPTNEPIDKVMKITNMSTGKLGAKIAQAFLENPVWAEHVDKIYFIANKLVRRPELPDGQNYKFHDITVETTNDLLNTMGVLLRNPDEHIDAVIHSAAVGDYKARYAARAEDVADEIARRILCIPYAANAGQGPSKARIYETVMNVLAHPKCVQDSTTKISSYEPNLMTMLDLTPKVVSHIKQWSPDTMLIAFKLLEGVSKPVLLDVSSELREKNRADFVMANDLAKIGNGSHWGMIVGRTGIVRECEGKQDIAETLARAVMAKQRMEHGRYKTDIKDNDQMEEPLTGEQKLLWPWWHYGWSGTDPNDWRAYATKDGLGGVPDIAEEATPLTMQQAMEWHLINGGDSADAMKTYDEILAIEPEDEKEIKANLSTPGRQGRDDIITKTVKFPDGMQMDIKCCPSPGEKSWTEAVLFRPSGEEFNVTEVMDEFFRTWTMECDGTLYRVHVLPSGAVPSGVA